MDDFRTLRLTKVDGILTVNFNREKDTNPFSRQMTLELTSLCHDLQADVDAGRNAVQALILSGGSGRCFSVGGDFNDVSALETKPDIAQYLSEIIDLYITLLKVEIPVIASIDRYAIGQGLQVALMSDWRIATTRTQLQMPELKNGTACPLGSAILESLLGRALMLELILDCNFISADSARSMRLLNQLTTLEALEADSLSVAKRLAGFPSIPFRTTKRIQNKRLINIFEQGREAAIESHVATVSTKSGQTHYDQILGRG